MRGAALLTYLRRAAELGPRETFRLARELAELRMFSMRQRALRRWSADPLDDAWFARRIGMADPRGITDVASGLFRSELATLPVVDASAARSLISRAAIDRESMLSVATAAMAHRFDLLGSGSIRVDYLLEASGLEGGRYSMAPGALAAEAQRGRMEALLPGSSMGYDPIDWHRDFKSGYRWDQGAWCGDLTYGDHPGVDVKVPWELSRFQHLGALALAHHLAPDSPPGRLAATEVRAQLIDWIAANPAGYGVNWLCAMDVALRAVSWLIALALLDDAPELGAEFRWIVAKSLYAHGRHIEANLEYSREGTGNHYLSDLLGLLCVGAALPEAPESDRWVVFALQELCAEMERQVFTDGVDAEGSTAYHHLVAELFLVATLVALRLTPARRARLVDAATSRLTHPAAPRLRPISTQPFSLERAEIFPGWYLRRLLAMAEYAADVTKPDGHFAQVGDHDSGRAYKLTPALGRDGREDYRDGRFVLALAGMLFDREDLAAAGSRFQLDGRLFADGVGACVLPPAASVGGSDSRDGSGGRQRIEEGQAALTVYPGGGVAVAQDGPIYLLATFARVAPGHSGNHFHNDLLGFELQWDGVDFVVDGGSFLYTPVPALRNVFRSTASHSTVAFDGLEQRGWPPTGRTLFLVTRDADVGLEAATVNSLTLWSAYEGACHTRRWVWDYSGVRIEDSASGPARSLVLNLAPGLQVGEFHAVGGDAYETTLRAAGKVALLRLEGVELPRALEGVYSEGYGTRIPNVRLVARFIGAHATTEFRFSHATERT